LAGDDNQPPHGRHSEQPRRPDHELTGTSTIARPRVRALCWHYRLSGTTTTGQCAWCTTWLLTEPIISRVNPPAPREPTTSRSASRGCLDECLGGEAVHGVDGHPRGPGLAELDGSLGHHVLRGLTGLQFGRIRAQDDRVTGPAADRNLVHGHHSQMGMLGRCFFHGPVQGAVSAVRSVDADDDRSHGLLLPDAFSRGGQRIPTPTVRVEDFLPRGVEAVAAGPRSLPGRRIAQDSNTRQGRMSPTRYPVCPWHSFVRRDRLELDQASHGGQRTNGKKETDMSRRPGAPGALPGHCGAAHDQAYRGDFVGRDSVSAAERGAPGDLSWRTMVDLVAAATRAPSMHNTQPWRFRFEPASQTI